MTYIGFECPDEKIDKIQIISLLTRRSRSALLREATDILIKKYESNIEKFKPFIEAVEKEGLYKNE